MNLKIVTTWQEINDNSTFVNKLILRRMALNYILTNSFETGNKHNRNNNAVMIVRQH